MPLRALVRIFVSRLPKDWKTPWRVPSQKRCTGTGFIIDGRQIVTNAHVVRNHTNIRVRQHGQTRKFPAAVRIIGADCDLAIITVADEKFWKKVGGMQCALREDIPALGEEVSCIGYPHGDHASITKGVVSRCTLQKYLSVQVDAAINPGNSGGPIFDKDAKCVGVARAHRKNSQLMCYIIPIEVLRVFIETANAALERVPKAGDGAAMIDSTASVPAAQLVQHIGMPGLGIGYQKLENDDLRESLGLDDGDEGCGILLTKVLPLSPADGILQKGDVLLAIDGISVGSDATVELRDAERINFMYLVRRLPQGTPVNLKFSRVVAKPQSRFENVVKREVHTAPVIVADVLHKIPGESGANCHGSEWVVLGGAVFLHLTQPVLTKLKATLPTGCTENMRYFVEDKTEQTIILGHVLTDDVNFGYHGWSSLIVTEVCGISPKNLAHFGSIVQDVRAEGKIDISFIDGRKMYFDMRKVKAAEPRIAARHSIPSSMSPGVLMGLKDFL
eukprot:g4592.t1